MFLIACGLSSTVGHHSLSLLISSYSVNQFHLNALTRFKYLGNFTINNNTYIYFFYFLGGECKVDVRGCKVDVLCISEI